MVTLAGEATLSKYFSPHVNSDKIKKKQQQENNLLSADFINDKTLPLNLLIIQECKQEVTEVFCVKMAENLPGVSIKIDKLLLLVLVWFSVYKANSEKD